MSATEIDPGRRLRGPELAAWRLRVLVLARCPECGADVTSRCVGRRGPRCSPHIERVRAARALPTWDPAIPSCSSTCEHCAGEGFVLVEAVRPCPNASGVKNGHRSVENSRSFA